MKESPFTDSTTFGSLEPLIPLDASDEDIYSYDPIHGDSIHGNYNPIHGDSIHGNYSARSELDLHTEISKLKQQSTKRFKTRWEEILEKYSLIDDDKQSDEIDLATGDIITDNGHLRSLGGASNGLKPTPNIWAPTYDWEADIVRQKRNKKLQQNKMKAKLKALDLHGATRIEPASDKRVYLPDNLLLLNPSPTKRTRLSPTKSSSPIKGDNIRDISPTKGNVPLLSRDPSPLKNNKIRRNLFHESTDDNDDTEDDSGNDGTPISVPDTAFSPFYLPKVDICTISTSSHILDCAFDGCDYCTGNKQLYEAHLLEKHSNSLHVLGYPIDPSDTTKAPIPSITIIKKLHTQFPPYFQIPPLPTTHDRLPLICRQRIGNERCKKSFLDAQSLEHHRKQDTCSSNDQLYLCPLLGCNYGIKNDYLAWRTHFITEKHHLMPQYGELTQPNYVVHDFNESKAGSNISHNEDRSFNESQETQQIQKLLQTDSNDGYESIDELFDS